LPVVTPVILAIWEAEIRRIIALGQLLKKQVGKHHCNGKKSQALHPIYGRKLKIGGSGSRSALAKSKTISPK
jgi:hypothetical protein